MKHVGSKPIETDRLVLRRLEITDKEMMFKNWCSDKNVTRFLRWKAHEDVSETADMITRWLAKYESDATYYWGIYLKNGEMIGSLGVTIISEKDFSGELGYKLGSKWWNNGYGSESGKAVIDYMFANTDIERISAYCANDNIGSKRVLEKINMKYEGLLKHYYKSNEGFKDCLLYAIIREDWK